MWIVSLKALLIIFQAYKMAAAFMLAWPYGIPRIMSSYQFTEDIPSIYIRKQTMRNNPVTTKHKYKAFHLPGIHQYEAVNIEGKLT